MSYTYEQWKKEQEEKKKTSYTYDMWKAEQASKEGNTTKIKEQMDRLYEDKTNKSFLDKLKHIGSNLGTGILSGTAGIGQSELTDMANQMNKGSQSSTSKILKDSINALAGLVNPMQGLNNTIKKIPERIGNTVNTFADKDKNAVEKITTIGLDASNAPIEDNQYKNLFDVGNRVVGKTNPNASNALLDVNNMISKPIQDKQQKLAEEAQEYDKVTQTIGNVLQVIGNMIPSVGASALTRNPNIGLATMALSTKGQATQEALNKGAELDQAVKIGNTKAMIEVGTEMLTGGVNIFGKGAVDDIIQKGIDKRVKNEVANFLLKRGLDIPGEIVEETISDVLGTTIDKGTVDPNTTYSFQDFGDTALTTMLSTVVLNAITGGYGRNAYNANKVNIPPKAQDIANNNNNLQTQQTIQGQNKIAQNGLSEQIDIANNQETLYNNNESESGINGEQGRNTNGIQASTLGSQKENAFSIDRYKQEETTIRKQGEVNYTDKDKNFATKMQNKYNKKTFIFDDTKASYGGGLSYIDNDTIMFGRKALDDYGYDFLEGHEILEDINKNHKNIAEKKLNDLKQRLQDDTGFGDVFLKYIADMKDDVYQYYINKPELVAKEIIGDLNGLRNANIDYSTLENYKALNPQLVKEIQDEVLNLENIIYNKSSENSNKSSFSMQNNTPKTIQEAGLPIKKKMNPTEIANLTIEDANTTPVLPEKNYTKGNKQSSFFRNVIEDAQFLNKDLRQEMSQDENIRYYKGITNAETLEKAYTDLQNGGQNETMKWFNKENKEISAEDIAKGWILLKQYQDSGDYQGAVEVAKKMRNMGTKAGQAVQAYNILSRLTPEGMFYYAQSELSEAYNKMAEGKSKEWISDNKSKFDLTPEETQIIKEKMESIQGIEDERTKKIALAEIQKIITDKIPPTASQSIKSWMRISMLFNPKTQVRNIAGNAVILPVNMTSDFIASGIDKIISKKTGVRTTGNTNLKNYAKGFGKGLYESYDDFRKGINTRNIEGNRFEVTEGKNFKDKGIGKALNRVDNMLSFMLDAGDRGFYEATFTNSINNQLVLNNTTKVTPDMIDIATQEALQRTWQDNNTYTNAVLKIRKLLNFNKGYGLGDILIPFAKTPANLTKAIVDYSPVGLTKTLVMDARKLNNSLQNGQYTPQLQHKFVQDLGKGMAGSFLYVLGYALAKAGVITGEADDDKDVKNFMKNSLGINSYSIKIGDKSFAYDWAQPVATPFAIMTNFEKYNRENPDASVIDKAINSINIGSEQLLQQSFMESINTVLNGNGTFVENLGQAILELPSRAVPTLSKQVADMVDGTQRTSFEYKKPVKSAINSVKAKLPFVSRTLPVSVDTLGNEIQKYGGDNNIWNVMFNPANMNKGELSNAGEEIYNVYMETGDATILPRTAPYYIDSKGERKTMTSIQRSEFQKITGKYVEDTINGLLNNKDYKKLSNDKKAELINEIVSDSYSKAKYDVLNIDSEQYEKLRNTLKNVSTTSYYDYKSKTEDMKKDNEKLGVLVNSNYTNKEKQALYENYIKSTTDVKYDIVKTVNNFNISTYLEYKLASSNDQFKADRKDDGTVSGKTISGSAKNKKYDYIINMKNTPYMQKVIIFGLENTPSKSDKSTIVNYISSLPGKTNKEKLEMLDQFSWVTIYKDGTFKF